MLYPATRAVPKSTSVGEDLMIRQYLLQRGIHVPINMEDIENWFTYHSPDETQQVAYVAIRNAGKELAKVIVNNTPPSADQTAAIRKVREAVATANASIACKGK